MEEGDLPGALPWLVEVLRLDGDDTARAEPHRIRLAAMLAQCPKPARVWFFDQQVTHAEFRPDGQAILTASADGKATVWDVATGDAPRAQPAPRWCRVRCLLQPRRSDRGHLLDRGRDPRLEGSDQIAAEISF